MEASVQSFPSKTSIYYTSHVGDRMKERKIGTGAVKDTVKKGVQLPDLANPGTNINISRTDNPREFLLTVTREGLNAKNIAVTTYRITTQKLQELQDKYRSFGIDVFKKLGIPKPGTLGDLLQAKGSVSIGRKGKFRLTI